MQVQIHNRNGILVASFRNGEIIQHADARVLASMLLQAGVQAEDVEMPDWRHGDSAPSTGEKIAIFAYLRNSKK